MLTAVEAAEVLVLNKETNGVLGGVEGASFSCFSSLWCHAVL